MRSKYHTLKQKLLSHLQTSLYVPRRLEPHRQPLTNTINHSHGSKINSPLARSLFLDRANA